MTLSSPCENINFNEHAHTYTVDGQRWPSVTQILSELGLFPRYPDDEYHRKKGSAVHRATELHDHGTLGDLDERLAGYLEAWKSFLRDTGFVSEHIELRIHSRQFRYAGTLDRYGSFNGQPAIVDIKSGTPARAAALQTAGYKRAFIESTGKPVAHRLCVQLSDNGRYKCVEYSNHSEDDRIFLMALSVWRWRSENV